jgi:hypothetical protein
MNLIRACCALLAVTTLGCHKPSRAPVNRAGASADTSLEAVTTDSLAQSAAHFTQAFYDWYAQHNDQLELAVAERPEVFAPALLTALQTDIEAQAKHPGELVGLDWDPFTASQDPCDPYQVEHVTRRGDTILVALKGRCTDAAPRSGPDVVAEVLRSPAGWVFANLRDPRHPGDLLADLANLREARRSDSAHGRK